MKTTLTPSNQTAWSWLVTTFYSSSVHNPYQARWYNSSIVAKQHHQPNVMYQLHSDSACLFHIDSEITNSVCTPGHFVATLFQRPAATLADREHDVALPAIGPAPGCKLSWYTLREQTWLATASTGNFNGKIIYKWGFYWESHL